MSPETRNLVWLVLGGALAMAAIAAATGIYVYRAEPAPRTLQVSSDPLFDPGDWSAAAPASGENRVTVRGVEADDPDWNFSYGREDDPYGFEALFGGRVVEEGSRRLADTSASSWRRQDDSPWQRYGEPERWRPNRGDTPAGDGGWARPEPSPEERIAAAGIDVSTPEGRLEQACLLDNNTRYACRCLVREARRSLSPAELDFLTRAGEGEPPATRLRAAGLSLDALPELAVRLVALDAGTRRACRVPLTL
ncbi:hypothetical protein E5163_07200 [Marinicauda algicola]|uniref:Uncharacterized protein n=1 Tax=Marinicauda algicola TaxID=2029849 RepID=A0A4S2H0B1_9PROT|nr:hypothetical protein [Marinicauda algicola]TGY88916.1 hypothetical protein E5163_07200 [Marinicauda algicola]